MSYIRVDISSIVLVCDPGSYIEGLHERIAH
eukprot:COSAG05_NODE_12210_length_477_cov_1.574074_2_plen_30_part_01